ncbi:RHS repeat-associated core domain-containing protein [Anaerosporobacter sp.]|uniref:RHS repeat-associated core domain-containing protein n=1 Tax=Anaerosporobacter sp. TaxID=1872529 RepID=UPI00286F2FBD|nr:RHS repeat-associated core domain-containing protein [Anaerosporobacter sp.]
MENQYTKVKFERDPLGRVTKEWQDYNWIASEYDELGNRVQVASSFGANILTKRNVMGQATHLVAYLEKEKPWAAKMEYNVLGQETQRLFSNGICSNWEYDLVGRPIFHEVSVKQASAGNMQHSFGRTTGHSETMHRRRYEWDVNYQLKKITNELTKGTILFSYDQFSNLVCAKESGFESIFRMTDSVGNLYESQDNSDRIYGAGSRLEKSGIDLKEERNTYQGGYGKLVTKGSDFFYDEEGNLAKKVEPNGNTWAYLYFGNGMLKKVFKPDQSGVTFKYDPLGRRIEKTLTKAGSEDLSKIEEKATSIEEIPWETIGEVRIRKPITDMTKDHVVRGSNQSIYAEETCNPKDLREKEENIDKVIRFLWEGNTLLHEWEESKADKSIKVKAKVDYKADFIRKLEKKEEEKARQEAERGQRPPDSLITWIFQDDFIPRAKITKDGNYSIISDYLGTPVEAYDEEGNKVWERELDIYGRVKKGQKNTYGRKEERIGEQTFIPFRFQGQYEDEEIGLYYNRFRYYSPEDGCYTQQDPIGLTGGNPTIYGYVGNTNIQIDLFGLKPTEKWMRDFIREILGSNLHDGGSYFFQTGNNEWYIGKANDFYRRLRQHLGTDKLVKDYLETLGVVVNPNGTSADHFKLESELMELFDADKDVTLSNKINSPGKNQGASSAPSSKTNSPCL